jgi:hypothetical protein
MLLHELSTKRLATCERSVIGKDIPGIPASIALHEVRKALARQTQWLPPQSYLRRSLSPFWAT